MLRRLATCAMFGLGACYSGFEGPGRVDSVLPPDILGSALTPTDAAVLCAARDNFFNNLLTDDDLHHYVCVIQASSAPDCLTAYDSCISMDYERDPPSPTCALTFDITTCQATIAEIEDCLTAMNLRAIDYYQNISCNSQASPPAPLPACEAIKPVCPGVG